MAVYCVWGAIFVHVCVCVYTGVYISGAVALQAQDTSFLQVMRIMASGSSGQQETPCHEVRGRDHELV